jgi:hypothetical protein
MYLQGWTPPVHRRQFGNLCNAPKIPLHQLGWLGESYGLGAPASAGFGPWTLIGPAVVSKSGGTASSALQSAAAGAGQGFAVGGPIGAGIGAIAGAIAGIWASHAARVKGAKNENGAINSAVQAFDAGIQAIFAAANSSDPTVNISGPQAAQLVGQLYTQFWQQMLPFTQGPGAKDASGGGANCGQGLNPAGPCVGTPGGHKCDNNCTATCCVGCQDLYPTMLQAVAVLNSPNGGTVTACTVSGSKYGANQRGSYTLTYTPPTLSSSASGAVSSLFSALTGGTPGAPGSSSSLLPLALVAVAAWAVLR